MVRCKDCLFGKRADDGDIECRFNAPRPVTSTAETYTQTLVLWPVVGPYDGCADGRDDPL